MNEKFIPSFITKKRPKSVVCTTNKVYFLEHLKENKKGL